MRLRVNIRQVKTLVYLLCVAALLGWGYVFYDLYVGKVEERRYDPRPMEVFEDLLRRDISGEALETASSLPPREMYTALTEARIDGTLPKEPPPPGPQGSDDDGPEVVTLTPIEDVLEVGMILWHENPLFRMAAITYKEGAEVSAETKERRLHLTEGSSLMTPYDEPPYEATVVRIEPQEVVFSWGEDEVTITPGLGREGTSPPLDEWGIDETADWWEGYEAPPEESVEVSEGVWLVGTRDLDEIRTAPERLLGDAISLRAVHQPGGGRTQLEITHVEPGSLPAKYGVQSGDRILAINGVPVSSTAAAINWVQANPDLPRYVVTMLRRGRELTLAFNVSS